MADARRLDSERRVVIEVANEFARDGLLAILHEKGWVWQSGDSLLDPKQWQRSWKFPCRVVLNSGIPGRIRHCRMGINVRTLAKYDGDVDETLCRAPIYPLVEGLALIADSLPVKKRRR